MWSSLKADRVGNLIGQFVDPHVNAELRKSAKKIGIEVGDAPRGEAYFCLSPIGRRSTQDVVQKIEIELEGPFAVRDGRRGQTSRPKVKNNVPGMIEPGRLREADLADNLRPQLQRGAGVLPGLVRQFRP